MGVASPLRRYVISGQTPDLQMHAEDPRVILCVETRLTDEPHVAGAWIAEEALRASRLSGSPLLPSADLVAAGGDLSVLSELAQVVGQTLRVQGFQGVWGSPQGILSNTSLPWMDDTLIAPFVEGLRRAGIGAAWYDGAVAAWHTREYGMVWERQGSESAGVLYVPASALSAEERSEPSTAPTCRTAPAVSPLAALGEQLANRGITLIDDPGVLPLDAECVVSVEDKTGTGAAVGLGTVWPATRMAPAGKRGRALVWVDGQGRAPADGEILIAVSCRRPAFIAEMPPHAVKIAVYDDSPEGWRQLLLKLKGRSPWTGRLPWSVPTSGPARHQSHYPTEQPHVHPHLRHLEEKSPVELIRAMISDEARALMRLAQLAPEIAKAVRAVQECWRDEHRLFYIGAGSAGRMGMLDAAEVPPTFGVGSQWAQGIMAGGPEAFRHAREGVEDDADQGKQDVAHHRVNKGDVILAITAHGNTPYVIGAVEEARRRGAHIIGVVNNPGTALAPLCDVALELPSGPEVLVGSTRLKAGTEEKVVLNTISTLAMVGIGRTYDNLMVDFVPSNNKLKERAVRVCMMATGIPRTEAVKLLERAQGSLKVAIVAGALSVPVEEGRSMLNQHGSVAAVIRKRVKESS